jgi:hypothetical protein
LPSIMIATWRRLLSVTHTLPAAGFYRITRYPFLLFVLVLCFFVVLCGAIGLAINKTNPIGDAD